MSDVKFFKWLFAAVGIGLTVQSWTADKPNTAALVCLGFACLFMVLQKRWEAEDEGDDV